MRHGSEEPRGRDAIDLDEALRRTGGSRETVRELAEVFLDECDGMRAAIHRAITDRAGDELHRAAHTLKGSVDVFGATRAVDTASQLETAGKQGDFQNADELAATLDRQIEDVVDALRDLAGREGTSD